MHHIEKFTEECFIENGLINRIVYGHYKEHCVPIYLETDEPDYFIRNVDLVYMNGWLMSIPGEKYKQYGQTYTVPDDDWYRYREPLDWYQYKNKDKCIEKLAGLAVDLYPDFQYVLNKWKPKTTCQLMEALVIWKEHPDIELLLALGFENIAFSAAFLRLSDKKKKQYCRWISKNQKHKDITYKALSYIVSNGLSYDEWMGYQSFINRADYSDKLSLSYPVVKYLKSQIDKGIENTPQAIVRRYADYKGMAIRAGHNMKDDYWRFPNNLNKAHDKVMVEVARIVEQEKLAKLKEMAGEIAKLKAIERRFKDIPKTINGYSIFISTDYDEWKRQADALHQCIIAQGYFKDMANGKSTIIFIQKDGKPIATAQVMPSGVINQFYADELDRSNCLPSDEVREAFNKWLDLVPKSKFKKRTAKAKAKAA